MYVEVDDVENGFNKGKWYLNASCFSKLNDFQSDLLFEIKEVRKSKEIK